MTFSNKIKTSIINIINDFDRNNGIGLDHYYDEPCYHPMAEGKYLSTIALLHKEKIISASDYNSRLKRSVERLETNNFSNNSNHACWGLGFSYKETNKTEPFLITTSIIAKGLLDNNNDVTHKLLKNTVEWLESYPWRKEIKFKDRLLRLPTFSPNTKILVTNTIAYWTNVLHQASLLNYSSQDSGVKHITQWILNLFVNPIGWPYTPFNKRVDLLHQCYIINALLDIVTPAEMEGKALKIYNMFYNITHMQDKYDISDKETALKLSTKANRCSIYPTETCWIIKYDSEARLWSYGELLVTLSRMANDGKNKSYWFYMAKKIGKIVIDKYPLVDYQMETEYKSRVRDTTHLIHGLCNLLILLQKDITD